MGHPRMKNPGHCVICGNRLHPAVLMISPTADVCSPMCSITVQSMNIDARIALIIEKFEDSPERAEALETFYRHKAEMEAQAEPVEDYMRPMGAPTVESAPVFKPMKPSASVWIGGDTDEEIAEHVLMVCWGTVAK